MRRLFIGLLIALTLIAVIESALRVFTFKQGNILVSKRSIYYFNAEPIRVPGQFGDLYPGESVWLIWHVRPYTVTINGQGLRNNEEVDMQAIRVLAIGDSFTFGPYVLMRTRGLQY